MANTTSNAPEATFRLGNVNTTVWSNSGTGESNRDFRTVQVEQRYKDGEEWKSSNRFTLDQLLRLRVCIDKVIDHISQKEMEG